MPSDFKYACITDNSKSTYIYILFVMIAYHNATRCGVYIQPWITDMYRQSIYTVHTTVFNLHKSQERSTILINMSGRRPYTACPVTI